ncbi:hypothetical protein [Streptomyces sp. NPDC055134]
MPVLVLLSVTSWAFAASSRPNSPVTGRSTTPSTTFANAPATTSRRASGP